MRKEIEGAALKNKKWKYKIGGSLHGLIPSLFLLALFGGLSIWLYKTDNSAYFFAMILAAFVVAILIAVIYRALFVTVLIYDDGCYHQTKPGKGKYYKYSEIKKAWVSSGKDSTDANNFFCNYKTYDGEVVRFPFFLVESDGVDYLIECVESKNLGVYDNTNDETEEYKIDGKQYGITYIIISVVILAVFSIFEIPMFLNEVSANRWFSAFFFATGFLLPAYGVIKLIVRYFFHKVIIENNRFYSQTNPFNGKYYQYTDIKSCREVLRVARHRTRTGGPNRSYYYFFFFTDITGRTRKFLFQKQIHGHEIDVLKERIACCNNREEIEEVSYGGRSVIKNAIRIITFILIAAMMVFFGYLSKNDNKLPPSKPSQNKTDVTQTGAPDFSDVHTVLYERGFETANIPTTYWFIEENKLTNVVSGIKGDTAFEFYEYTDGETVDLIFNQISYDISKEMESDERDKHITELSDGNKIFTLTENGICKVVIYKEDTLVYAHSPETSNEIQDILIELGYMKKE